MGSSSAVEILHTIVFTNWAFGAVFGTPWALNRSPPSFSPPLPLPLKKHVLLLLLLKQPSNHVEISHFGCGSEAELEAHTWFFLSSPSLRGMNSYQ